MLHRLLLLLVQAALLLCVACREGPEVPILQPGDRCEPGGKGHCDRSFCLALDEDGGVCTVSCRTDAGCPSGMTCQAEGQGGVCKPGFRCSSDSSCPIGHRCDVATGACYIPVQRDLCAPCTADAQCPEGGVCLVAQGSGERFCTAPCAADGACPSGYLCREVEGVSLRQCTPLPTADAGETCEGARPLCASCSGDAACGDGNDACVENYLTGESFCAVSCSPTCLYDPRRGGWYDGDERCEPVCPEHFTCADLSGQGEGPFQCVPDSGTCEGWCSGERDHLECGVGQTCDIDNNRCVPATDGRPCAPCAGDEDCGYGAWCVRNEATNESFCALRCIGEGDCLESLGAGFSCLEVDGRKSCIPAGGSCVDGVGRLGDSCVDGGPETCLSRTCIGAGAGAICSARCEEDADCGDRRYRCCALVGTPGDLSYDCASTTGAYGGVCAPAGGAFADDCAPGRPPCENGFCLDLGAAEVCTSACVDDADCDRVSGEQGTFVCREARAVSPGGAVQDEVRVCFPAGGGSIGSDCAFGPAACEHRLCIKKDSGNVCTSACETDDDCPERWTCGTGPLVDGAEIRVCLPPTLR